MRAAVFTLGCKVNQYESRQVAHRLAEMGFDAFEGLQPADLYVINTCSVTAEADKKSRQTIARALKLNPAAKIIIIGCSSQNSAEAFKERPEVIGVFGTAEKVSSVESAARPLLLPAVDSKGGQGGGKRRVFKGGLSGLKDGEDTDVKTRAYVKIQDGCNNFCSYCIVPYLRGRSVSRPLADIMDEVRALAEKTKEIVLTGIDISSYGKDIGSSLTELVYTVGGALKNLTVRLRLGSLECGVIDEGLLRAMKECGFCDHFHVSLQSGSQSVLRRMNRHYTPRQFLEKVDLIRKFFPFAGVTTDVIAGFSGETQAEHEETKRFLAGAEFSDLHVFVYSPRAGTRAYALPRPDKKVREERAKEIGGIKNRLKADFIAKNLGKTAEVYAEQRDGEYSCGFTSNYIKVYTTLKAGELKSVRLARAFKDGTTGEEI